MTKRIGKTESEMKSEVSIHSESFIALVELARFLARRAAEHDFEAMLEATKNKHEVFPEGTFEK